MRGRRRGANVIPVTGALPATATIPGGSFNPNARPAAFHRKVVAAVFFVAVVPAWATSAMAASAAAPHAGPALAAVPPACARASTVAGQATATAGSAIPWPQQRYGLDRLAGVADGTGVLVAVIDSGVDPAHPQLAGALVAGYDGLDTGGDGRLDCVGHGTAVASIIAGRPVDGVGFRGVAPAARILPIRVSEQQEMGGATSGRTVPMAGLATAIRQAVAGHARVINLSLVSYTDDPAVREATAYALANDVVVVAAAGNRHEQGDPKPYPAAYPGVIGVGAVGPDGTRLAESETGSFVDLVAPGGDVTAGTRGRGYAVWSGTSFAVPFVAASAALIRQYQPRLSAAEVTARLVATADPAPAGPTGTEYGAGVLNPYRAVVERVGGTPVQLAPVPPRARSAGALAAARRTAGIRARAFGIAAAGGGSAAIVALAAAVLSRGRRRRWRPGIR